jgi:hypothetical protein
MDEAAWAEEEEQGDNLCNNAAAASATPSGKQKQQRSDTANNAAASMYSVAFVADAHNMPEAWQRSVCVDSELAPMLAAREETVQSLAELAGQAVGELPAGTQSLRKTMQQEFASRKKFLAEEEVERQVCGKCTKKGHTEHSCPDQTQSVSRDRTEADAWVRRLIEAPRVDIAAVNRGLSLAEGVAAWRKRGAEFNQGNPWAGSTKMEDSLREAAWLAHPMELRVKCVDCDGGKWGKQEGEKRQEVPRFRVCESEERGGRRGEGKGRPRIE